MVEVRDEICEIYEKVRLMWYDLSGGDVYITQEGWSCHVISCHIMSCHVMSYCIMSCHGMICHDMPCRHDIQVPPPTFCTPHMYR